MSSRLRVLFAGTPEVAVPTLHGVAGRHDVVAALTRPPARRRRRGHDEPSPVAHTAHQLGIDVLEWPTLRDQQAHDAVAALDLDVAVVVAYGALVPKPMLEVPRHGWINLHFSLLPAWRGAAPVQAAIRHGDEVTGATVFRLTEGLDEGPILGTMTEQVRPTDTSGDLLDRLGVAGAPLVIQVLEAIATGRATATDQVPDGVSHAPQITVADARVPWALPALAVDRFVRSMTPNPGAWTELAGQRLKIGPLTPSWAPGRDPEQAPTALGAGQIAATKREVWVGTGGEPVLLGEVAPAGKSWLPAADWARGARLNPEARFDGSH